MTGGRRAKSSDEEEVDRMGVVEVEVQDSTNRVQCFKLVDQALRLQLAADGGDLPEVEECLKMALDLDPDSLEALQQAARFYDAVEPDPAKAHQYALACRDRAAQIVSEMEQILGEKRALHKPQSKAPASRHIGGIIGPY